jgi:membrane-associated phospholipid phosphatase
MFELGPALLCLLVTAAPPAESPPPHTGFKTLLTELRDDVTHLPSTANLYFGVADGALALGVHPADQEVNARLVNPDGSNNLSFPSGHAAITFAAAAVIERHLGWMGSVGAYAVAAYVSTSRLHDNVHYLSDVIFGAAIGTIAGRTVTVHGREHWTLGPSLVPGGVAIVAARTP